MVVAIHIPGRIVHQEARFGRPQRRGLRCFGGFVSHRKPSGRYHIGHGYYAVKLGLVASSARYSRGRGGVCTGEEPERGGGLVPPGLVRCKLVQPPYENVPTLTILHPPLRYLPTCSESVVLSYQKRKRMLLLKPPKTMTHAMSVSW